MTEPARAHQAAKQRVFVVDDHSVVRHGLATLLGDEPDMEVCGEAGAYDEALAAIVKLKPDIVLVDITLKDRSGLELIREMRGMGLSSKALVLSMHDETVYAERALAAGALGYVMKERGDEALVHAIRAVADGKTYVSEEVTAQMLRQISGGGEEAAGASGVASLTARELEILECIGRGLSTKKIAEKFELSARTVEVHRSHIKKKLGCEDAAQVFREAVRWVDQR